MDDDGMKMEMATERDAPASTLVQPLHAADNALRIEQEVVSTAATAAKVDDTEDDDDEMPLLFMDGLPSDFQRSAQLAAIATFMEGSDDEENDEDEDSEEQDDRSYARGASRRQTRRVAARQTRKQAPYAKKGGKTSSKQAAKELQLYLSMFKM